jgi:hypothetical protein
MFTSNEATKNEGNIFSHKKAEDTLNKMANNNDDLSFDTTIDGYTCLRATDGWTYVLLPLRPGHAAIVAYDEDNNVVGKI